ncbi:MAG: hypothetical protein A2117_01855 [Candidatus Wildermuthbacteria bacterium GWA2_46_15]|uniref:Uncharacterized protein n=1 Tax=Candidatus Wildermuthbacteria bacterium GWA2_46_15 TaxID=1802443 RepID=A0A1G2QPD2_9BACT|nr:MAG: hypothetical protein A2117_01855 [Candidatus Wildermuthbacteria bacterium GWA2_46_15]
MKELDQAFEAKDGDMIEAKKISFLFKVDSLQQLILQRYQALTTISTIGFAIVGIVISTRSDLLESSILAFIRYFICWSCISWSGAIAIFNSG